MRKKPLMVFGLASFLALALAFATDKAQGPSSGEEAQKAALAGDGNRAHPCPKGRVGAGAEGSCLKKSSTAKAEASGNQNVASSGIDCPKSADCPKADCDKAHCLKKSGAEAKAGSPDSETAIDPAQAETEI